MSFNFVISFVYFAEPTPPTEVTFTITGTDSAVVSWTASQSQCGAIANYSVTYQLTSCMSCSATVYTTGTSVTLQGLIPNAEYSVVVSATNSRGGASALSIETPFTMSTTSAGMFDPSHRYMHYITHALCVALCLSPSITSSNFYKCHYHCSMVIYIQCLWWCAPTDTNILVMKLS